MPVLTHAVSPGEAAGIGSLGMGGISMGRGGMGNTEVPSVWRNGRAAQKVDALAASGLDDIEIPAFLRRQAD